MVLKTDYTGDCLSDLMHLGINEALELAVQEPDIEM